jgi:hypothetical protein
MLDRALGFLWPDTWSGRLLRLAAVLAAAALAGLLVPGSPVVQRVRPSPPPPPPPAASVPGEDDANRIEGIYYDQGPRPALEALRQDYLNAYAAPASQQALQKLSDEISRLEAHTTRYMQLSPLAGIATEWCLQQHGPDDFPLRYNFLLPARDSEPDARTADVELDKEMVKVLQINWINYANLTRSQTRGYVADEQQITIKTRDDLLQDQRDQEVIRLAARSLRRKS